MKSSPTYKSDESKNKDIYDDDDSAVNEDQIALDDVN